MRALSLSLLAVLLCFVSGSAPSGSREAAAAPRDGDAAIPLRAVQDQEAGTIAIFRGDEDEPIVTQNALADHRLVETKIRATAHGRHRGRVHPPARGAGLRRASGVLRARQRLPRGLGSDPPRLQREDRGHRPLKTLLTDDTLAQADTAHGQDPVIISQADIQSRDRFRQSMVPEGLLEPFSNTEVADRVACLMPADGTAR